MVRNFTAVMVLGLLFAGCGKAPQPPAAKASGHRDAINKGVAFLVGAQNDDGSFGGEGYANVGVTGMAGIAIARAPKRLSAAEQKALDRAVAYMLSFVQDNGSITNGDSGYVNYHTSLALTALMDIAPEEHRDAITKARGYLIGSQFSETNGNFNEADWPYGGWRYSKDGKGEANPDLSNSHFTIQALHDSGLPKDSDVYKKALAFLKRCQSRTESNDMENIGDDGGAIYSPKASKADMITLPDGKKVFRSYGSMTYALLKSYIFCNVDKQDPLVQAAYKWIQENYALDANVGMEKDQQGLYYGYVAMARALQAYGDPILKTPDGVEHKWAEELAARLVSLQAEDGSWVNPEDRWYEGDKALVTSYAVWALDICDEVMQQQ